LAVGFSQAVVHNCRHGESPIAQQRLAVGFSLAMVIMTSISDTVQAWHLLVLQLVVDQRPDNGQSVLHATWLSNSNFGDGGEKCQEGQEEWFGLFG